MVVGLDSALDQPTPVREFNGSGFNFINTTVIGVVGLYGSL